MKNKTPIDAVIVVEGKSDKQLLETFIKADFLICNGSAIDGFDKDYLITLANTRGVIILTDPDYPGQKIRNEISSYLPVCKHAFVRKEYSIKHHKVGVAEASKEEVLRALENVVTLKEREISITYLNFYELGLVGNDKSLEKRLKIEDYFRIGHGSAKTCLKRLNMLGITLDELKEVL